jgi:hypothetical protein
MKKMLPLLLLALLFVQVVGFYLFVAADRWLIQEQMIEALASSASQTELTFSKAEYTTLCNGMEAREIKVNGKLFDIHHTQQIGDNIHVFGSFDTEETNLLEKLSSVITQNRSQKASMQDLLQWIFSITYLEIATHFHFTPAYSNTIKPVVPSTAFPHLFALAPLSPPPDAYLS